MFAAARGRATRVPAAACRPEREQVGGLANRELETRLPQTRGETGSTSGVAASKANQLEQKQRLAVSHSCCLCEITIIAITNADAAFGDSDDFGLSAKLVYKTAS